MNFDDLQSAWNSDKGNDIVIPDSVAKLKSVATPVQRIRKNMRKEFLIMVCLVIMMAFMPMLSEQGAPPLPFYAMYAALLIMTIFYYVKFYFFYQRLNANTLSSKDNLYAVYYDIKLNVEMYKLFNYSIIPLLLLYQVMCFMDKDAFHSGALTHKEITTIVIGSVVLLIVIGLMIVFIELWIKHFYGKYLEEVGQVLNELREE